MMEWWKVGIMRFGIMEDWNNGKLKWWKVGMMEGLNNGKMGTWYFYGILRSPNGGRRIILKPLLHVLWDSSSPSASQNDTSAFSLPFWGIRQRRMTKNLKQFSFFMRFFIPLRSIQNDIYTFPVILRSPADRQTTKNLKQFLFLWDSSFRFAPFRMTT